MVNRFINGDCRTKILFGNDTDVSYTSIVRMHQDNYVVTTTMVNDEDGTGYSTCMDWDLDEFNRHFYLQYGSPMQYIGMDDFLWMTSE